MWQVAVAAALAAGSSIFAKHIFNSNEQSTTDPDQQITKSSNFVNNPIELHNHGSAFEFSSPDIGHKKKKKRGKKGKINVLEQKKSGFSVCVKKRRISKFGPGKCDSCSSSKGDSVFSRGIGVGIMCMMSAGKTEISKLNTAVDETAKVVNELKSELFKRKASHSHQVSSSKLEGYPNLEESGGTDVQLVPRSIPEFEKNIQNFSMNRSEEGQCARSIPSEEPQGDEMDMDLLEAELESELQKLSWCSSDASVPEERRLDSYENDASTEGIYERDNDVSSLFLSNGVVPSVLNQKLCNLLLKQQEGQIVELESELLQAQSKLHEREAELQALKDCVRQMSQFSIAIPSDKESEKQLEGEKTNNYRTKVGLKRSMSFESYSCHITSQSI